MNCIFGIDIGGTEIKIGKFYQKLLVLKTSIKTNLCDGGSHILSDIFIKIDELTLGDTVEGIGIGVPGPVVDGVVLGAQNLNWKRLEAKRILKERYPNCEIAILNDANSAALGEMDQGGAKKYQNFVFLTIGTGIGGGIVINGQLVEGATGSSGEIGHIRVAFENERLCTCGLYDCIEQYASATGIVKTANQLRVGRNTVLNTMEVTSKNIFDHAKLGDEVCLEVVAQMIEKLATATAAIANIINPEAILIGGGVSKAGEFLLTRLQKRFRELAFYSVRDTKFGLAELGNDAGIYGDGFAVRKKIYGS